MSNQKSIVLVLSYLLENTIFTDKASSLDRLIQLAHESNKDIPEDIYEAYRSLSEFDLWEIIRKISIEGKRQNMLY